MIAVAPLLHEIIPHGWHRMCLFDPDCSITAAHSENLAAYAIFRERTWKFMDDPKALVSIVEPSFHATGIGWTLHLQGPGYLESAYYRETEALLDACWVLDAMIGDEGRTIAGMQLTRPRSPRPFTTGDMLRLDRLRPWLAYALRKHRATPSTTESSFLSKARVLHGQMILTPNAKLLFQSIEMDVFRQSLDGIVYNSLDRGNARFRWTTPREIPLPVQKLVMRLLDGTNGNIGDLYTCLTQP